jgi:predicted transcriptional regulator
MSGQAIHSALSRRERQVMEVVYRSGRVSVADVHRALSADISYSTVRTQLRVLERKGYLKHEEEGLRYIYSPTVPRHAARKTALKHLVATFFAGSVEKVVTALLGSEGHKVSVDELDRIATIVERARKERSK